MKIRLKVICLLILILASLMLGVSAQGDTYQATVEDARAILEDVRTSETSEERVRLLDSLAELMPSVDPDEDGYGALVQDIDKEELACAQMILSEVDLEAGTARASVGMRRLRAFLKLHAISDGTEGYSDLLTSLSALEDEYEELISKTRDALDTDAYYDDIEGAVVLNRPFGTDNELGKLTDELNVVNGQIVSRVGEESGMDGDNSYYTVHYDISAHIRTNFYLVSSPIKRAIVYEFDLTTFGTLPSQRIWMEDQLLADDGSKQNVVYFTITPDGHIAKDASGNEVIFENAITKGEWTHFSIVYDYETGDCRIYLDYELIHTVSYAKGGVVYKSTFLRIGANPKVIGSEFSLDNMLAYEGHSPRYLTSLESMSLSESFSRLVKGAAREGIPSAERIKYFDRASQIRSLNDDSSFLSDDIALLEGIDRDSLVSLMKAENLAILVDKADKLNAISKGEATYSERVSRLNDLRLSISSMAGNVDAEADGYKRCTEIAAKVSVELANEELAAEFVSYVNSFYTAVSIDSQQESYEAAMRLRPTLDLEYLDSLSFPKLAKAYEDSDRMFTVLTEKLMIENSKKLHACISYVIGYDTPESWAENYSNLVTFVKLADEMIRNGGYDAYYNGLDKLLIRFAPMREYFSERILSDHIEYVKSELLKYDNSTSYFEKYGISIKLRDYIEENNIDTSLSELPELVRINEEHIAELLASEEEYDLFLKQNTALFIETCKGLVGSVDYQTVKKICKEAELYFFNMDVSDASAQNALQVYDVRMRELRLLEERADKFINAALSLAAPDADKLALIIYATSCLDGVDRSVDGVENAMLLLQGEMDEYDASVSSFNSELSETRKSMCAIQSAEGTECLITLILSLIK